MFSSNTSAVSGDAVYIEDVFSTWLYTGNGSTQTITNGIDTTTYGGLVWIKARTNAASGDNNHELYDTARGVRKVLNSNQTSAENTLASNGLTAFGTTGFTVSDDSFGSYGVNGPSGRTFASWTFRKQPKFFDVVTWTADGTTNRQIPHNLGSQPGFITCKRTNSTGNWRVYHRSQPGKYANLEDTGAFQTDSVGMWTDVQPTYFISDYLNAFTGATYVAYLFAHNAGGFGLTGTDNVISCGSYTGNGSSTGPTITLGYEPQWVLLKNATSSGYRWYLYDTMRGLSQTDNALIFPNESTAESNTGSPPQIIPTATGFQVNVSSAAINQSGSTFIYIAIRRGPMKTPTTGTSVYQGTTRTGTGAAASISGLSFPPDAVITRNRDSNGSSRYAVYDKLRGPTIYLDTAATDAEFTVAQSLTSFNQTGESFGTGAISNFSGDPYINWQFRRAPGFFDVVCYTGNGTFGATNHNLGVIPELTIYKKRSGTAENWGVIYYLSSISYRFGNLNLTDAFTTYTNDPAVAGLFSSTQFCKYYDTSGQTYVAYLFATVAGVSKVGSYTGTGALQTINCGFTGGARFVLIKRTDSTGDWFVYDSTRGISSGNDPYLLLNSATAEVTGTNYVDTTSVGFQVTAAAPAGLNANGGTYIFLAIA